MTCFLSRAPLRALLAALFAAALLAGCKGKSAPPDTLLLAIPGEVKTLDPALGYDTYSIAAIHAVATGLVDYDDAVGLKPDLAASWSASDDQRTFSFTLRDGLRFSNGRPVTSQDFKYSLERVLNPKTNSQGATFFENIEGAPAFRAGRAPGVTGIQTPDPQHIVFRLSQPSSVFLNQLAMTFAAPVAREAVESQGERFGDNPVSVGPYRVEQWQRGRALELVATQPDNTRPRKIRLDLGVPESVQMSRFQAGDLDVTSGIPAPDLPRLRQDPARKGKIEEALFDQTWYIGMNTRQPPFDDVRVRQAVNFAVDREKQVQLVGAGEPAYAILPPHIPGYEPTFRPYRRDLERARKLVESAGVTGTTPINMLIVAEDLWRRRAQAVQADLKEVGLNVTLQELEFTVYLGAYKKPEAQCWYGGWFGDYPDPGNFLEVLFHSKNISESGSLNSTRYANPEVDRLLDRARSMRSGETRTELYRQVEQILMRAGVWAPLYYQVNVHLSQPYITGARPHPVWPYLRLAELRKNKPR